MSWLQRYRIRLYLRNSFWVLPALSIPVALVGSDEGASICGPPA
jgi:hypothetical protein